MTCRAEGAPIFTLVYRGDEVDALVQREGNEATHPERLEHSRTILLSHETGECFITKQNIQLRHGDPPMVVQCITDMYDGYNESPRDGDDKVSVMALKIVDIAIDRPPMERVSIMQAIGVSLQNRPGISNRLSIMWCGDVTRACIQGMLNLRDASLRHTMSHVVILTGDPYVQIHLQVPLSLS